MRGAVNRFVIQSTGAGSVTWCTEGGSCRVEYVDVFDVAGGWTGRKWESSIECWVLLVEEELPDEVVELDLSYVLPECLKRGGGILGHWLEVSVDVCNGLDAHTSPQREGDLTEN